MPIKIFTYLMEGFVKAFMRTSMELMNYVSSHRRIWSYINPTLKEKNPFLNSQGPTSPSAVTFRFSCCTYGLAACSSRITSSHWGNGADTAINCSSSWTSSRRDKASATLFSLPFLYSIVKSKPMSLYSQLCWASVVIFWDQRYLKLLWSVRTTRRSDVVRDRGVTAMDALCFPMLSWHRACFGA